MCRRATSGSKSRVRTRWISTATSRGIRKRLYCPCSEAGPGRHFPDRHKSCAARKPWVAFHGHLRDAGVAPMAAGRRGDGSGKHGDSIMSVKASSKVYPDAATALRGVVKEGMTLMCGGFGACGIPENLIDALHASRIGNLTVVSNNAGLDGVGLGLLLKTRQIRKMISSYVGENKLFAELYLKGELELEFNPQGTLAERIRAGGAGIPAFFTKTGVGTLVAEGKEIRDFDGESYVMERGLVADLAIVHAWKGDREGNLVYRKTARNFNPVMATAAKVTVAQVENIVEPGEIDPDQIHTPGIFVQRIVQYPAYEKRIEQRTVRKRG